MIFQLANEFCTSYIARKCNVFDKKLAVQMTKHLCMWLSNRGFTNLKISMNGPV